MPTKPNYPVQPGKQVTSPPGWPPGTTFTNVGGYIVVTNPDGSQDLWVAMGPLAGGYAGHKGPPQGTGPQPMPEPGPQPAPEPGPDGIPPGLEMGPLLPPPGTFPVLDSRWKLLPMKGDPMGAT